MRIAVLGTGLMGRPLAERLLEADHRVVEVKSKLSVQPDEE